MNEDFSPLESFNGITGLFPLPNLVFFPQVVQPLHIFEHRYRQLMADSLENDRMMTLVLLKPGWEADYEGRPPLHSIACIGKIVADQKLPDGRYNLLLRGLSRVQIIEELPTEKLYRTARVKVITDTTFASIEELMKLRHQLAEMILPRFTTGTLHEQMTELFECELGLGELCDILAFALEIPVQIKQTMLEECDATHRAHILLDCFKMLAGDAVVPRRPRRKPPDFSAN